MPVVTVLRIGCCYKLDPAFEEDIRETGVQWGEGALITPPVYGKILPVKSIIIAP